MPLQNRVTPFGDIVAVESRGLFTGNRGIIHDPATKTLLRRRWTTTAWITCVCDFRGRRREVMAARSWTELFFLDETTALAAGHRPCYYCRRDDAHRFADAFARGNGLSRVSAKQIDATLHGERLDGTAKRLHPLPCAIEQLPDGAIVTRRSGTQDACYLIRQGVALLWSFDGYLFGEATPGQTLLLTPPSTVNALLAGYRPLLHSTALTH